MAEEISVAKKLTVSASAEGDELLYKVPGGARLKITHVMIYFPTGSQGYLEVYLVAGLRNLYPTNGVCSGDNTKWEFYTSQELDSGSEIKVKYKNNDSANPHTCYILLEGVVER